VEALDGPDAVLRSLDPEQREVALAPRGPVCVLAGAGTGKTRAVAHRIAYLAATGVVDPARVLAVTFTTRAAGELRARLRQLGTVVPGAGLERVQARTFHAAALRQLQYFWPSAVGGPVPQVLESKISLLAEAARRLRLSAGLPELRDAAAEVEWAKVTQVRPDDYATASVKAGRTPPFPAAAFARLYAGYEDLRRERHVVDFESVLELTAAILVDHEAAASAVHDQYESFVVDEFQDVNPLQKLLLEAWLGGRDDVCVVGDPRQTIYSFTGATPAYLTGFPAEFPAAAVIRLVRNYRSTPQIVHLANRISHGSRAGAGPAGAGASLGSSSLGGAPLVAQQAGGPEPQFTEYPDEAAEAAGVARQIAALVAAGQAASRIAVLFRINAQTQGFEAALGDAGVPFLLRGTERFFERPEVRQAVALLRGAARSVSAEDEPAAQVRPILAGIGLSAEPPVGRGTARERWESLEALAQLAADHFAAEPRATLGDLAAELALRSAIGQAPAMEGVTLGSLHAAKGLEWDVVFLPGLTEGMLPIIYAQSDEAIAEERRLFYVGVTRARARLYLSWSLARAPGGRRTRKPSRFLDGLRSRPRARDLAGVAGPGGPGGQAPGAGAGAGGARGAAAEDRAGEAGDALFTALREWRAATAQEQGVPSYVVFSDATLLLIVGRRPASRAELAGVPGVGAVKLDRYGAAVLDLCARAAGTEAADGAGRPGRAGRAGRRTDGEPGR
jgi:DNA helicase II / ATP-dependent DNA helicase PcrA